MKIRTFGFVLGVIVSIFLPAFLQAQPRVDDMPWLVYMQVEPCVDNREQWMMVAKEQPAFGLNHWIQPQSATPQATMGSALAQADFLSLIDVSGESTMFAKFENYCCHDWAIYRNLATNTFSVIKPLMGSPGNNFVLEQGGLCCESARIIADLPGGCRDYTLADGVTRITIGNNGPVSPAGPVTLTNGNNPPLVIPQFSTPPTAKGGHHPPPVVTTNPDDQDDPGSIEIEELPEDEDGGNIFEIPDDGTTTTTTTSTTNDPTGPIDQDKPKPPATADRWVLESATVNPPTPTTGWSYTAQSSSAQLVIYNGDKATFQWTPPPGQIDSNGFTVSMSTQGTPADPRGRVASIIGVTGSGLDSDTPADERNAYAYADSGSSSASKSVTLKPRGSPDSIEVEIGMQWAITFTYKYRRAN